VTRILSAGGCQHFPLHRRRRFAARRTVSALLIALFCGALAGAAHARGNRAEVSAFSCYRLGGDFKDRVSGETLGLDGAAAYGVAVNIPYESGTQIELLWSHGGTDLRLLIPCRMFHQHRTNGHGRGYTRYGALRPAGLSAAHRVPGGLTPSPAVLEALHFGPGTRFACRDGDG